MSCALWRIGVDAPTYEADDLSGKGAELTGGRWNDPGVPMIYAAMTRSMACLETLVHLNAGGLPLNRYLVEITAPDALWTQARRESEDSLSVGWDATPPGRVSTSFGTDWVRSQSTALLIVPSAIIPEECNVLINPVHPDSAHVTASKVRRWTYDPRLQSSVS